MSIEGDEDQQKRAVYVNRHVRFGWAQLLLFLLLGTVLEAMHGFKVGWYLDAGEETRRLLLTLAHAHGVLLGLVSIVFGTTLSAMPRIPIPAIRMASPLLLTSSILMPTGFLLGGLVTYGGDPGVGVFLVAPGAALLALSVALVTWATFRKA
jgi:hypothetical protein